MKLYLNEIVTTKENQTIVSPTITYNNDNSEEASRLAEIDYHAKCNYNLQQGATLKDFLVEIITETGNLVTGMKRFYRFPEPTPEPEPEPNEE